MARPIEPTPTLRGKDAENFYIKLEKCSNNNGSYTDKQGVLDALNFIKSLPK